MELLIAIIVIIILATIGGIGLQGWRASAAKTEVKNDLQAAAMRLKDYKTWNNAYPPNLNALDFSPTGEVAMTYTLNGAHYCLGASSTVVASVKLYINSATSLEPTETAC